MRRVLATGAVLLACAAAAAVALTLTGGDGASSTTYKIVFDNAFGLAEGGDLRVAGVTAGRTTAFRATDDVPPKAEVTAVVDKPGFAGFRADASCGIEPQSVIGEYFVDCRPGSSGRRLEDGDTVPVARTSSTIPLDLVQGILRRPYRERLRLIISELGTGLAGRPEDLQRVVRRAHPGLRETNRVLRILGRQNRVIERFVSDADTVVEQLEARKQDVSRFISEAGETADIAAARRPWDVPPGVDPSDTRADLRVFLKEYSKGLEGRGARGLNEALRNGGPALRNLALVSDAALGLEPGSDLQRVLEGQGRTAAALVRDERALKGLVTSLDITAGALAREDAALEASVPALRDALRVGHPALASVNSALPSLRRFAVDALPGVRSSDPTLKAALPFIRQARGLVAPGELRGTARELRTQLPRLSRLNRRLVPLLGQARTLSSCTSNVLSRSRARRSRTPTSPPTTTSSSTASSTAGSSGSPARAASPTPTTPTSTRAGSRGSTRAPARSPCAPRRRPTAATSRRRGGRACRARRRSPRT
ncbi:MAG: MlaD family protein [Thermoleophilaceae bacterium]